MAGSYTVTFRSAGEVRRTQHDTLDAALEELAAAVQTADSRREAIDLKVRTFEPSKLVSLRAELRGPGGMRAGIDVRGDGSAAAYRGRVRRRLIDPVGSETAAQALRRELGA